MIGSSFLMREKRVENVSGQRRAYALRDFTGSVSTSAPKGRGDSGREQMRIGTAVNASD
jgi:hypothetical protein